EKKSNNSLVNDDPDYYQTVYMQGSGKHLGHLSILDKWTETHREYTNYYEDPNDDTVYGAIGTISGYEEVSWTLGVTVEGSGEITNVEYDDAGLLSSFVYKDSDGECYQVDITYDEDRNVISYTVTDSTGMVTTVMINEYDNQGRVLTYTEVCGKTTTTVSVEHDDNDNMMTAFKQETTEMGSTTILERSKIEYIQYNDLGMLASFNWSSFTEHGMIIMAVTINTYNEQGFIDSYSETEIDSDSDDVVTRTERLETEYDNKGLVTSYTEITNRYDDDDNQILNKWTRTVTNFTYDEQGQLSEKQETVTSNDSTNTITYSFSRTEFDSNGIAQKRHEMEMNLGDKYTEFFVYNTLGQVVEEIIIDVETGNMTDIGELKKLLEDLSQDEFEEFLMDYLDGKHGEFIEVNKSGEDFGKRDNRSLIKKHHTEILNIYQEAEYALFADVLREWTRYSDVN
ncbi:MAG: hypothetical protein KAJ51_02500, partial [Thermoplasmata archaeon]|nr:hypothetical protein [Thermoplasmata archaeon]